MNIISTYILLENVVFFAHHGVSPQETEVGNMFTVDLRIKADIMPAMQSDDVADTISYADIYLAVKQEMSTPSKLLEHVCGRIVQRLFQDFPAIDEIEIKLKKQNPPMGADIDYAGVEMQCRR